MSEEVSVPLLPIHFLAPAWLYTRLTKDALAARGWSIATFETKRGCGFGLDSPPHQLGLVSYLSALRWSCLSFCIACESLQFWLFDQQSSSPQAVCMYFGQPLLLCPLIFICPRFLLMKGPLLYHYSSPYISCCGLVLFYPHPAATLSTTTIYF